MVADVQVHSDDVPRVVPFLWMPVWLSAMLHLGGWLLLSYWLVDRVQRTKEIFMDLNMELPGVVVLIVQLSDVAVQYWYLGLVFLLFVTVADATIDRLFLINSQHVFRTLWFLFGFAPPALLLVGGIVVIDLVCQGLWGAVGFQPLDILSSFYTGGS